MITISQLRNLNKNNGGHFFSHQTMKLAGETLKSFRLEKMDIPDRVRLTRKKADCRGNVKSWVFDTKTGRNVIYDEKMFSN